MGIRNELTLRLANSPGALSAVCRVLSDEGVNAIAMSLESSGQLRLIVATMCERRGCYAIGTIR